MNKTKRNIRTVLRGVAAAALLIPFALASGCEDSHHDSSDSDSSSSSSSEKGSDSKDSKKKSGLVGTWKLTAKDGSSWYVHFKDDGSWQITDDAEGNGRARAKGDYSTSGDSFKGSMVNPGVGDGEIEGTVKNGAMTFDFIEHWHSPYKHNVYSGVKL